MNKPDANAADEWLANNQSILNMINSSVNHSWRPLDQTERLATLDALRGLALLGVLVVNLLCDFRVPLSEHILTFHTHAFWADRTVDVLVAVLLEFKAMALFSLLFGVGLAVFGERAKARGALPTRFLARRLLILLALGLCHQLLIWNGDILTLYAVCGFVLLPILRVPPTGLAIAGIGAITLSLVVPLQFLWPRVETLRVLAEEAARVYSGGGYGDVLEYHWREMPLFILPLLASSFLRTWGLMALGAAAWRAGIFRQPERYQGLLWAVVLMGGTVGLSTNLLAVYSASTGQPTGVPSLLIGDGSHIPLALAYAAGLLLAMQSPAVAAAATPFAAVGQMALTNYLTQSVVLGILFYGYGLGLYGQLGSAAAVVIALTLFAGQIVFSIIWLRYYRFGPVEWLWRSLTYGQRQPMRRVAYGNLI